MLFTLCILLPLLWLLFNEIQRLRKSRQIAHTPGLRTLPFIGNAHQMGKTPNDIIHFFFGNFYKYNQGNFRIWAGSYLNILITDPKDIEFILSSKSLITKSDIYDMLHPWVGQGLLTAKGYRWQSHRKMIMPSFHFKILQEFQEVMARNSTKFMKKLSEASRDDSIFDFYELVEHLTLDILCETSMGISINAMHNPHTKFAKSLAFICSNISLRAYNPLKRKLSTYRFFPEYKEYCNALKILKEFTYDVINKRIKLIKLEETNQAKETPTEEISKRKMAFLDNLLSAKVDGRSLTLHEIYEEVSTFIFAGNDTSSSALSFVTFLLSRHLDVQQKVYEEQLSIMKDHDLKANATYHQLNDMKYLDLVIKEAQRLYPSVPVIGRHTEEDCTINGKFIPKDTSLNLLLMALGYNDRIFPDPYRFKPERFDPLYGDELPKQFEYVPFSAGPRNCIGQKFALLQIKTVVSQMVRNFEILPALDELESKDGYVCTKFVPHGQPRPKMHKYDPRLETVLTLKSENGIMIRMRERK
uniref:Cytochrome P450 n=1 Tax=Stomoxys calcitrans TaxID=35570 RepID=A0A1I8PJ36_STOCA